MISERAIVYPNVRLGKNCVIEDFAIVGAGSVVTKDVEAKTVVAGNPARFIKRMSALPYNESRCG
jgi:maltose O-acetyltransferase